MPRASSEHVLWGYVMPIHDHQPSSRGRAFFWGGLGLGVLFLVALVTRGFGGVLMAHLAKGGRLPKCKDNRRKKTFSEHGHIPS